MEELAHPCLPTLVDDKFSYSPRERQYKRIGNSESDLPVDAIAISPVGKRYHGTSLFEFYPDYVDNLVDAIKALHDRGMYIVISAPIASFFVEQRAGWLQRAVLIDLGFCCKLEEQPCPYSGNDTLCFR